MQASIVLFVSMVIGWPIWTTKTPLPQPLSGSGCAVVGETIYVVGGRDSQGNRYATNYAYDPFSNDWTVKTSMSNARANLGCAVVNGKIYAIGGWVGPTATAVVEEYDPLSDTWTTKAPMPTPRYTFGIAAVADKIYVIGGMNMQGQIFNTVQEYDPLTDTWATKTPMPTSRMGPGCAAIFDSIYVYGGSTMIGGGLTTVNERYDPTTNAWATKASMPTARYALGGFAWYHRVFALGGYDYWSYHTTLEEYMPSTNTWSTLTPMQYARQSIAVGMIPQYVYVIGGWNNGAFAYNEEGWFEIGIEEHERARHTVVVDINPNPFRNTTDIRYEVMTNGRISMEIYDVGGRMVRNLHPDAQRSTLSWDGRDDSGNILPNGTYLLVVDVNGVTSTEKAVLIR